MYGDGMKASSYYHSQKLVPYVFVLPFLISIAVFYVYPIIGTIIMSFQQVVPGQTHFIGLANYKRVISNDFLTALKNSSLYTILTILILVPGPIILAVLLSKGPSHMNNALRAAFFIPSLVSVVVAGTLFRLMFAANGKAVINAMLAWFGLKPVDWILGGARQAMFLMVLVAVWRWTGVNIIYFLAGLQAIPEDLYDAAAIDGAGPLNKVFHITLPLLRPTIIFVTTISIFGGFAMFEESYVLWQGVSPNNFGLTIVWLIYQKGFQLGDMGTASAIGLVLMVIVFTLSLSVLNLFGFFKREE